MAIEEGIPSGSLPPVFSEDNLPATASWDLIRRELARTMDWVLRAPRGERGARVESARRLLRWITDNVATATDEFRPTLDAFDDALDGAMSGNISDAEATAVLGDLAAFFNPDDDQQDVVDEDDSLAAWFPVGTQAATGIDAALATGDTFGSDADGTTSAGDGSGLVTPGGGGDTGGAGGTTGGGGGGQQTGGGGGQVEGEQSRPRQVPGGGQVWRVGGRDIYLAYTIPGTNTPLVWRIEDPERLEAIFGPGGPDGFDREMTEAQFRGLSPWQIGGLSSELAVTEEDPWQVFMSEFDRAVTIRPWLEDPSVMAVIATAYLEGRDPTQDELSQTDWWNNHTAAERDWMERAATAGDAEVQRLLADATMGVMDALREGGMANPPHAVAEYIARKSLTGGWSEQKTNQQIRKIVDPFAPGRLDRGLLSVIQDPERGNAGDINAISQGRDAVRRRVRAIFENRNVAIGTETEPEQLRLERITEEIVTGQRDFDDVRESVDRIAVEQGGRPGGLDVTRQGETTVREMAVRWLGPTMGDLSESQVRQWAGRIRNDPDAEAEFREYLQGQRLAMFPGFTNDNLTYEDIVQPIRQLVVQTWGQPPTDEEMLVDLANMQDFSQAQARLRKEGLSRGISNVVNNATGGMLRAIGGQVRRSADF